MLEVRSTPIVVLPRKDGSGIATEFRFSVFDTEAGTRISPFMDQTMAIIHRKLLEDIHQMDPETYQFVLDTLQKEDENNG